MQSQSSNTEIARTSSSQVVPPPAPNGEMLAAAAQAAREENLISEDSTELEFDSEERNVEGKKESVEESEVHRAKSIAQRLGITNLADEEYDVPTYLRRNQEQEL